jgi:hypothetical protein
MPSVQINLNGQPSSQVLERLQENFEHHGIQGLTLAPVEGNPELQTLSWRERQSGVAGVLNRVVGAEEERVLTAVKQLGAEVVTPFLISFNHEPRHCHNHCWHHSGRCRVLHSSRFLFMVAA